MDIGYHFDLTAQVMREKGFQPGSVNLALFANGVTDLLGNIPLNTEVVAFSHSKRLHCDNLFDDTDVRNFWKQFLGNLHKVIDATRGAHNASNATAADRELACIKCLYAIGTAFHTLQDICSHSNWSELHPPPAGLYKGGAHTGPRIKNYNGESVFGATGVGVPGLLTGIFSDYYEHNQELSRLHDELAATHTAAGPTPTGIFLVAIAYLEGRIAAVKAELEEIPEWWVKEWKPYNEEKMKAHPGHGHPYEHKAGAGPNPGLTDQNLDHQDRRIKKGAAATAPETYWDEAYVTSYASGRHLMAQLLDWIGAGPFLDALKGFELSWLKALELARLQEVMNALFLYIKFKHEDGHWKGPGSGDLFTLLTMNLVPTLATTLQGAKAEIFGSNDEPPPALVAIFLNTLHTDDANTPSLLRYLYDQTNMGNSGDAVTVPAPALDAYVVTLTVHRLVIPPLERDTELGDPRPYSGDLGLGSAPEPYLRVVVSDGSGPPTAYRERTIQRLALSAKTTEYYTNPAEHFGEVWQVIHIAPATATAVTFAVHVFDDDLVCDDELRINPRPKVGPDHLEFTVTDLAAGGKLLEDEVTAKLTTSSGAYALIKDETPVLFVANGSEDGTIWPFDCPPANVEFSVTVAKVKSP